MYRFSFCKFIGNTVTTTIGAAMLTMSAAYATPVPDNCPNLVAPRSDQFHGDMINNDLSLFMAGNQWVVFDKVLEAYYASRGGPISVYTELVPPGVERNQILAGCITFGAENPHNFNPLTITTKADIFASTNANLINDLGGNHKMMHKAKPYIRNRLDLLVPHGNPKNIGVGATPGERIVDMALDLLDPTIRVSQVDHVDEGIHNAINNMYKKVDRWIRINGSAADVAALDAALAAVSTAQPGSPAATRTDDQPTSFFDLATNDECHYSGDPDIADGTLRLCEFAVLNKANTHETRVHHVETPARVRNSASLADGSDTGPLWVSEVIFAENEDTGNGVDLIDGMGIEPAVNFVATYYIGIVDKSINKNHKVESVNFLNFLLSDVAQNIYADGGFIRLTTEELNDDSTTLYFNDVIPAIDPGLW